MKVKLICIVYWISATICFAENARLECYRINCTSDGRIVEYIDGFVWFQDLATDNQVVVNLLLAGRDGDFTIYAEHIRLEAKRDDGTWQRVTEFETKRLKQEIISKKVSSEQSTLVKSLLLEVGYPNTGPSPPRIRIDFGKVVRK